MYAPRRSHAVRQQHIERSSQVEISVFLLQRWMASRTGTRRAAAAAAAAAPTWVLCASVAGWLCQVGGWDTKQVQCRWLAGQNTQGRSKRCTKSNKRTSLTPSIVKTVQVCMRSGICAFVCVCKWGAREEANARFDSFDKRERSPVVRVLGRKTRLSARATHYLPSTHAQMYVRMYVNTEAAKREIDQEREGQPALSVER
ncbi:uncharacterized protein IWZ02DRAFT_37081 [Phyllosticta citriasiana]|uniref:Uncharacterized protein n=1 Tax=Phyllosticta citriasiana TaxID=595635 RepID=A0ABR1KBQ2_9PEZI